MRATPLVSVTTRRLHQAKAAPNNAQAEGHGWVPTKLYQHRMRISCQCIAGPAWPASTGAGHDNEQRVLELSRTLRGPGNGGNSGSRGARGDVRPVSQGSAGVAAEITNEGSTSSFASFRGGRRCYSTNARQTSFLRLYVQIFICPVRLKKKQRRRNSVTVTTCESWLEWNPGCSTKKIRSKARWARSPETARHGSR